MATNNFTSVNPTGIYAIDLPNDEGAQDDLDFIHENVIIVKKIDKVYSNNTTVLQGWSV